MFNVSKKAWVAWSLVGALFGGHAVWASAEESTVSKAEESKEQMSVTRINHFTAKAGSGDELFDLIESFLPHIRESAGCQSVRLMRNVENADEIVVVEVWDDEDSHRASAQNVPPGTFEKAMALMAGPPRGAYYR